MSQSLSLARAHPSRPVGPELMFGAAALPLWGYFAGAAMLATAFWWMTRWMQFVRPDATAMEPVGEAMVAGEAPPVAAATPQAELVSEPEIAAAPAPTPAAAPAPAAPAPAAPAPAPAAAMSPAPAAAPAPRKGRAVEPPSKPH